MSKTEDKKKLRKAFDPILKKSKEDYDTEAKQKKLEDVKKSTEKEKQRFHNYNTAEDIRKNFQRDLNSESAKKVHSDLKVLDLPPLPELKDEFFELCDKLGIKYPEF